MPFNFTEKEKYDMWCMQHNFIPNPQVTPTIADTPILFIGDDKFLQHLQDKADRYSTLNNDPF